MKLLNEIQQKIKAPKTQRNLHGNYMYRSCSDILSAVKPYLSDGVAYLHMTDELVEVGNRNYVKATVTLTQGSEKVVAVGYAREADEQKGMNAGQLSCSTSSYARKLALSGLFAIDDSHDAGNGSNGKDGQPQSLDDVLTGAFKAFIAEHDTVLLEGFQWDRDAFIAALRDVVKKKLNTAEKRKGFAWTVENVQPFLKEIKPKDTWVESNADA